jgi:hypothetical protein
MRKATGSYDRLTRWMRWTARIWSVPIMLYALIMVVGYTWSWMTTGVADPHAVEDVPLIENLPPIFLLLSVVGLGIAWRRERLGGTIALLFLLGTLPLVLFLTPITRDFPRTAIPYVLVAIVGIPTALFVVCGWRSGR